MKILKLTRKYPSRFIHVCSALALVLGFSSCEKKSGEAVILEKEHIAAREIQDTPAKTKDDDVSEPTPGQVERVMRPDEIAVDQYVMRAEDRGTSKDPRAGDHEQWILKVEMVRDGRKFDMQTDRPHWERLHNGDRAMVTYRQGKYTGTVWDAEFD